MGKTIYIHIGGAKTGSSSLQSFLSENRDWLKQHGCLVPRSEGAGHHPLALSVVKGLSDFDIKSWRPFKGSYVDLWRNFREEVDASDCPTILISSEHFTSLADENCRHDSKKMISWIGKQLIGLDVRIVCYLRSINDHAKSIYKQHVKTGKVTETFAERMERLVTIRSVHIMPTTYLDLFSNEFGVDNLILRYYHREKLVNGDIVDDFLDVIGLEAKRKNNEYSNNNPSLPDDLVDMKRVFNAISNVPRKENQRIGMALAKLPVQHYDVPPIDDQHVQKAIESENQRLFDHYAFDLGDVGQLFANSQVISIEKVDSYALMSLVWKNVREAQDEIQKCRKDLLELRGDIKNLYDLVSQHYEAELESNSNFFSRRLKTFLKKRRWILWFVNRIRNF